MKRVLLCCLCFLLFYIPMSHATVVNIPETRVSIHLEDEWIYATRKNAKEAASLLQKGETEVIRAMKEAEDHLWCFLTYSAKPEEEYRYFSGANYLKMRVSAAPSYQKSYSELTDTQLKTMAQSFMKDGKFSGYEILKTPQNLVFIVVQYTSDSDKGPRYAAITQSQGLLIHVSYGFASSADQEKLEASVMEGLNRIEISQKNRIGEYFFAGIIGVVAMVICIVWKRKVRNT